MDRTTQLLAAALLVGAGTAPLAAQQRVELPARDRGFDLEMTDVFSVGGSMAVEEHELFGDIGGRSNLAFDGAGNLYVFDDDNYRVVVFDRSGAFVRQFGKAGEGPDEWRSAWSMNVFRDGTVWIGDLGHRAFHVYDASGERTQGVSMDMEGSISLGGAVPDARGGALYTGEDFGGERIVLRSSSAPMEEEEAPGRLIERWTLGEELVREPFFTAWAPPKEETESPTLSGQGFSFRIGGSMPRRFEPSLRAASHPDGGLLIVDTTTYTIEVVGPDGSVDRVIERPSVEPIEVTERIQRIDKERRLEDLEKSESDTQVRVNVSRGGQALAVDGEQIRNMQRNIIEQSSYYPEMSAIASLGVGWEGTTWVRRTARDWWEEGPVDLVSAEGEYLGTLDAGGPGVPDAFGPDGLVAYVEKDELDVATIVVRRLPESVR